MARAPRAVSVDRAAGGRDPIEVVLDRDVNFELPISRRGARYSDMLYTRARLQYLAALGIPAIATSMVACSGGGGSGSTTPSPTVTIGETGPSPATTTETAATTGSGTASAAPTASATATQATAKTWIPEQPVQPSSGPPKDPGRRMPSCPNGLVCVDAPASLDGAAAPAPHAQCAAQPMLPEDATGMSARAIHTTFNPGITAQERGKHPLACCYSWVRPCPGGRPFRGEDGGILAGATGRGDWLAAIGKVAVAAAMGSDERALAAAHYEREAAFEHASIAAFARASMGLLGLGAPPDLVTETHAAAMDEVEHARIGFALASVFAGEARGPARLAVGAQAAVPASLGELLAETFVDACVGETVAALALREAAEGARDAAIAGLLSRVAEDEERHAALAWRTVAWALRAGGEEARRALNAVIEEVGREAGAADCHGGGGSEKQTVSKNRGTGLAACGILGAEALGEVRGRALREVVLPCAEALSLAAAAGSLPAERVVLA